jgi:ABC-type sugar transport system ATPase subunit
VTLREGRLTGEIMRHEATEEKLMQMMTMDKPVYAGAST